VSVQANSHWIQVPLARHLITPTGRCLTPHNATTRRKKRLSPSFTGKDLIRHHMVVMSCKKCSTIDSMSITWKVMTVHQKMKAMHLLLPHMISPIQCHLQNQNATNHDTTNSEKIHGANQNLQPVNATASRLVTSLLNQP
jgi:hypothetical protein